MKSTREKIMQTLLAFPGSTINDLAETVGINGISVRHHLTSLEADDLVTSAEERHGVGRPHLVYSLTDKGLEQFPTSYLRLSRKLLEQLRQHMSSQEIEDMFENIGVEIAESYSQETKDKSLEERMRLLQPVLMKEGFITELKKNGQTYSLSSLSCPYYRIAPDHPEVCALDNALIQTFLDAPIFIESCIFKNADRCIYQIPITTNED
ncbi:MAG: winged helix-turn-helix transcriptional regulator [Anaerolineaceae bacterium]|nr:winged helix-turn-helix transcriptional regulator [Anaerolineaceae bacterium]